MTDLEAVDAIKTQWLGVWPDASADVVEALYPDLADDGVPSSFPNEPSAEPSGTLTPWCELAVDHGRTTQWTMGRPAKFGTQATIYIALRWPAAGVDDAQDGETQLLALAGVVRDVLQTKQLGAGLGEDGVITKEVSLSDTEKSEDGLWWVLVCAVPCEYTEVR